MENFAVHPEPASVQGGRPEISNMELFLVCEWSKLRAMEADNISDFEIRRATAAEADSAFALVEEYFATVGVVLREDRHEFIEEYFGEGRGFWLAQTDGEVAGCIGLRKLPLRRDENVRERTDCSEIKRMYVREQFRGQGIAQRLVETAEQFAREAGYAWIYLDTTKEMKAAAKLYERNGFLGCDRYNQNPQAAIFMRKSIS